MNNFQDKANFIWQVADDILRGSFKQHEYGDVILPFVVLRRLDCVLEAKKENVLETFNKLKNFTGSPQSSTQSIRIEFLQYIQVRPRPIISG